MNSPKEDFYERAFYSWLEAHGVVFVEPLTRPPFQCTIDLNELKAAILELLIDNG
jgi:hypothetical protein